MSHDTFENILSTLLVVFGFILGGFTAAGAFLLRDKK